MQKHLLSFLKNHSRRPYRLFQIEPTLACNLDCIMCPWTEMRSLTGPMLWKTFERIIPYLPLAEGVDFTGGGEPLVHPRLPEMLCEAKKAGCQIGFSTNGTRLTPRLSQQLLDLGLDWISFSVDAADQETYERIRQGARFDQVIANIESLRDQKSKCGSKSPRMMMVIVLMGGESGDQYATQNYYQLPAYLELGHRLGVEQVIAKNLDVILKPGDDERRLFTHPDSGEKRPAHMELAEILARSEARARELGIGLRLYNLQPQESSICENDPLHNLFFNWEGQVSPCITLSYAETRLFAGEQVHAPCQVFGDIRSQTLDEIWNSPGYVAFRAAFEKRRQAERNAHITAMTQAMQGEMPETVFRLPPAPGSCRTCYYLYGI